MREWDGEQHDLRPFGILSAPYGVQETVQVHMAPGSSKWRGERSVICRKWWLKVCNGKSHIISTKT